MEPRSWLVLAILAPACSQPPDPTTIEGGFARMAEAAERGAASDLFASIDEESRNSISAIHKAQREAKLIVARAFPAEERSRAVGRWRLGADAQAPVEVFVAWCEEVRCVAEVRDRLSSIARTQRDGDRARVFVRRGREYPFARSRSGRWGLSLFAERLGRWKVEVYRDLDAIRASATVYEQGT